MGNPIQVYEFAKVSVNRNQNSVLRLCTHQQCPVSRIWPQQSCFEGVVPLLSKPFRQTATSTSVDEKPHCDFTVTAASVSPAITACA